MNSQSPPAQWKAVLAHKCPKCRKGTMFAHRPYQLKSFLKMTERCTHCGFRFEIEPGFWWGAMYINYAFNVAIFFAGLICYFVFDLPEWLVAVGVVGATVLLLPLLVRFSRVLMLHLFAQVKFDPQRFHNTPEQNAPFFEEGAEQNH